MGAACQRTPLGGAQWQGHTRPFEAPVVHRCSAPSRGDPCGRGMPLQGLDARAHRTTRAALSIDGGPQTLLCYRRFRCGWLPTAKPPEVPRAPHPVAVRLLSGCSQPRWGIGSVAMAHTNPRRPPLSLTPSLLHLLVV